MSGITGGASARTSIALVAGREITTRLRSRAYLITTALLFVAVVAGGLVLHLAQGSTSTTHIAVTSANAELVQPLESVAKAAGKDVDVVPVPDDAAAQQKVKDGDADAALTGRPDDFSVVVEKTLSDDLTSVLTVVRQQVALDQAVTKLGGDPAQVNAQVAGATLSVTALEPQAARDGGQIVAGYIAGILLFITLQTCAQMVAQGVVEEKSSRVVELLLATIRPWQLMIGKVLGIGVVGLLQVAVIVAGGVASASAFGLLDTSEIDLGQTAAWALVFFVIGFTMYALAIGALASLVSRQEDVGSVAAPVTLFMVIPYVVGISIAPWSPDSPVVVALSYIPFCSPMVMPIRVALGTVDTWEVVLSAAISIVLIPVLVWLAGRIYSNAVLRTGAKVRLRDALRAA